ncbi:hypothetical protein C481_11140 [Natrialba asiatica DSM 12278]|uniref:Uncharacterized protein n=1 Tax=Natrialba asiatica (strain ATCC 700177 / DSM 12278 / JCM 9576 / FERM P-10747 / NBRC 102637 / 172P1) TaxID=29540 RepID=M0AQF7_NATA1|nr:hypothetical protein C481_11140 [Natrialba asiatica DSM 12278]
MSQMTVPQIPPEAINAHTRVSSDRRERALEDGDIISDDTDPVQSTTLGSKKEVTALGWIGWR